MAWRKIWAMPFWLSGRTRHSWTPGLGTQRIGRGRQARRRGIDVVGPLPADTLFHQAYRGDFDAVVAMYHDQALIPFKSLSNGEGVNYTAGIEGVRTSPDHGTAFDIAGKGIADETSFREALFTCLDILGQRQEFKDMYRNPLRKVSMAMLARAVDEKLPEE